MAAEEGEGAEEGEAAAGWRGRRGWRERRGRRARADPRPRAPALRCGARSRTRSERTRRRPSARQRPEPRRARPPRSAARSSGSSDSNWSSSSNRAMNARNDSGVNWWYEHVGARRRAREPGAPQRGDRRLRSDGRSSLPPPVSPRGSRPASCQRLVVHVVRRRAARRPASHVTSASRPPGREHAPDLAQRPVARRHELEHERREREVERAVVERQPVGGRLAEADPAAIRRRQAGAASRSAISSMPADASTPSTLDAAASDGPPRPPARPCRSPRRGAAARRRRRRARPRRGAPASTAGGPATSSAA